MTLASWNGVLRGQQTDFCKLSVQSACSTHMRERASGQNTGVFMGKVLSACCLHGVSPGACIADSVLWMGMYITMHCMLALLWLHAFWTLDGHGACAWRHGTLHVMLRELMRTWSVS